MTTMPLSHQILIKIKALKTMRSLNEILDDKEMDKIIHNKLDDLSLQFEKQRLEEEKQRVEEAFMNLLIDE